jgi:hypothetical protein
LLTFANCLPKNIFFLKAKAAWRSLADWLNGTTTTKSYSCKGAFKTSGRYCDQKFMRFPPPPF